MNQISRTDSDQAQLRRILDALELPNFVGGFDIQLDEFDDEPAAWVTLQLSGSDSLPVSELKRRAKIMFDFQEDVKVKLAESGIALWVFFPITYLAEVSSD